MGIFLLLIWRAITLVFDIQLQLESKACACGINFIPSTPNFCLFWIDNIYSFFYCYVIFVRESINSKNKKLQAHYIIFHIPLSGAIWGKKVFTRSLLHALKMGEIDQIIIKPVNGDLQKYLHNFIIFTLIAVHMVI